MLGELVPCAGGPPIPLHKPRLLLGRQRDCDVPLCYPTISSRHCEMELREGYWFVRDLGSSNGTRVNGDLCVSARLMPKDVLALAKYRYALHYALPAATPARGARPEPEKRTPEPPPARTSPAPSLGELVPCGGGDPIPLRQPRLVVGRHDGCDIVLRFSSVSGKHCELEWLDGAWTVRDLGSHNGIRVDGARCESQALKSGSVLAIANLRYRIVYGPAGAPDRGTAMASVFGRSLLEAAGLARSSLGAPAGGKRKDEDEDEPRRRGYTLDEPE